jgi:uncharacterized Fe-S cluster protein YjdI
MSDPDAKGTGEGAPDEPTPSTTAGRPVAGVRRYARDGAAVTYETALCRHAAECIRGLPEVFDTARRPWIQPANASIDDLDRVIARCPTRALKLERDPAIRAPAARG